jgi:hypothetical protein
VDVGNKLIIDHVDMKRNPSTAIQNRGGREETHKRVEVVETGISFVSAVEAIVECYYEDDFAIINVYVVTMFSRSQRRVEETGFGDGQGSGTNVPSAHHGIVETPRGLRCNESGGKHREQNSGAMVEGREGNNGRVGSEHQAALRPAIYKGRLLQSTASVLHISSRRSCRYVS